MEVQLRPPGTLCRLWAEVVLVAVVWVEVVEEGEEGGVVMDPLERRLGGSEEVIRFRDL
jgi:hypothetical protein